MPIETKQIVLASEFVLNPANQPLEPVNRGYGVMDSNFGDTRQAAEPWRYFTGLVPFTVAAGDLTLATGTEVVLFTAGVDDPSAGNVANYPTILTNADTDANRSGALVKLNQSYVVTQVAFDFGRPFGFTGNVKTYLALLDAYEQRLLDALRDNLAALVTFQDEACEYDLGLAKFWPTHYGPRGGLTPSAGAGIGPANLMPLRRPVLAGPRDADDQVNITLQSGYAVNVSADPAEPLPGTLTTVMCPVTAILYGYPQPMPCAQVCIIPG